MRVFIDGDGAPDVYDMLDVCEKHQVEAYVYVDYNHFIDDKRVILCDQGKDSVDLRIVSEVRKKDIVVTQDYGLAGLVLSKNARVLHVLGNEITLDNIDELLTRRYLSYKERKMSKHMKGPSKRKNEDKKRLIRMLELLIIENSQL